MKRIIYLGLVLLISCVNNDICTENCTYYVQFGELKNTLHEASVIERSRFSIHEVGKIGAIVEIENPATFVATYAIFAENKKTGNIEIYEVGESKPATPPFSGASRVSINPRMKRAISPGMYFISISVPISKRTNNLERQKEIFKAGFYIET